MDVSRNSRWTHDGIDAIKGILILVILFGHSDTLSSAFPEVRKVFYFFNVQCFLLLPFIFPSKPFSFHFLRDRAVRYLVPYTLFFLLSVGLTFVLQRPQVASNFQQYILDVIVAWYTGVESSIDEVASLRALWFLPVLFTLVCLRGIADSNRVLQRAMLASSLLMMLVASLVPDSWYLCAPFGVLNALFFLAQGLFLWYVLNHFRLRDDNVPLGIGMLLIAVGIMLTIAQPWIGRVAGAGVGSYDITDLPTYTLAILLPTVLLLGMLMVSRYLGKILLLTYCGKHSLTIYLFHGFVYAALGIMVYGRDFNNPATTRGSLGVGGLIAVSNVVICCGIAAFLVRVPNFAKLIFPRDWEHWVSALPGGRKPARRSIQKS